MAMVQCIIHSSPCALHWRLLVALSTLLFVIIARTEGGTLAQPKKKRAKNYDNLFLDDLYKLQSLDMLICWYFHHMYTRCRRSRCWRCVYLAFFVGSLRKCSELHYSEHELLFQFDIRSNYSFRAGACENTLFFGFCIL